MIQRILERPVFAVFALASLLAACGDARRTAARDGGESDSPGTTTADSNSQQGGGDPQLSIETSGPSCEPACGQGLICSSESSCIPVGTCLSDQDCENSQVCNEGTCEINRTDCEAAVYEAEGVEPNILFVLDRSCSMRTQCADPGPDGDVTSCKNNPTGAKWPAALTAISTVVAEHRGRARFGMHFFPDPPEVNTQQCKVSTPVLPVGLNNEDELLSIVEAGRLATDIYYPDGPCVTPINAAVHSLTELEEIRDPGRRNFVLFVTDGQEHGCSPAGSTRKCRGTAIQEVSELLAEGKEVGENLQAAYDACLQMVADTSSALAGMVAQNTMTAVIGFGIARGVRQLEEYGKAGGAPNPDPESDFYPALNLEALNTTLGTIVSGIVGCDYSLSETPTEEGEIDVFLDGLPLESDQWTYDPANNGIQLQGTACQTVKNNLEARVEFAFNCRKGPVK